MKETTDSGAIQETLMQRLSDYLTATVGLHFAKRNWRELRLKMTAAMADFGFDAIEEFMEWLLSVSPTQSQIEILASHLTVGETYFFRERRIFEILEQSLLPGLIADRRKTEKRLRFWSAGCSTGEEPYSLAILLEKLIPDLKDWKVTILATDINTGSLRKAEEAIYTDWSFRDNPPWFKERYFRKLSGNRHQLQPGIREMVAFSYLNLSEDRYPALQNNTNAMDLILCRNVLMYFAHGQIRRTVERFHRSLLDGGCLVVSPVETSLLTHSPFTTIRMQDSTFYRKGAHKAKDLKKVAGTEEERGISRSFHVPMPAKRHGRERLLASAKPAESKKRENTERTPCEEASVLYQNGLYPEAEKKLREHMSSGRNDQESLILFIKILANRGKLEEALCHCREAVSADKCNVRLHYLLATILDEGKQVEEARVSLKRALYLDHNFVLAHFTLANMSLRSGKAAEARKHFGNVMDILSKYKQDEIVPESDGITAGRLAQIVRTFRARVMS